MGRRVLVVSQRFWPENFRINDICHELTLRGLRVDVLCGQPNYPEGQFFEGYRTFGNRNDKHGDVRIYRAAEIKRDGATALRIWLNYVSFAVSSRIKAAALKKNRYDCVLIYQSTSLMMSPAALKIGRKQNIPVIMYAIDVWPQSFFREMDMRSPTLRKIFSVYSAKQYQGADRIIIANEQAEDYFTGNVHIHPGKINYIPLCPDRRLQGDGYNIALLEKYGGSFNIVFVGGVTDQNDFDGVVNVGKMIYDAGIRNIKIIIVGKGNRLAQLKKKTDKARLWDIFFFEEEDRIEELPKYYNVANALLRCPRAEIKDELAPLTELADYMSMGKPILGVVGGQEKRIIRQTRCGYTSEPGDEQGLFDNIMRLYRAHGDDISDMGKNALKYQQKNFDREDCMDKIMEVMFRARQEDEDGFVMNRNIIKIEEDWTGEI
ncbi:MAG: glycosyltransferase family 4 protein [Lachnospiraceae bacterium]|jgi:colanic acid biosynthesis glycosyl transferase WcaI